MIDDLTLKARIMAADQNNIEKLLPRNAGGNRREAYLPGYANKRYGKEQAAFMQSEGEKAGRAKKIQTTQERQAANLEARQNQAANSPNMIYPTKAPAAPAASKIGEVSGTPGQDRASLSASNDAQQKYLAAQGVGSKTPISTPPMPGGENETEVPDNTETKIKVKNGADGPSEVQQITTHKNNEVPKPTAELDGFGKTPIATPDLPPDTGKQNTGQITGYAAHLSVKRDGGLHADNTTIAPTLMDNRQPSPAIPGSPPAPPATIPLPEGSPAPPATIPLPEGSPAPPPPNMAAPLPHLNTGNMNTGGGPQQNNNPVFNIGNQGQGQGQGQAPAAPQNDPKQNAKNMQVANATTRSQTSGGLATNPLLGAMTMGGSNLAGMFYNKYQRGQGKKELAELTKRITSPYSKVLSVFEIRKGISARNTTEVLRRGRI